MSQVSTSTTTTTTAPVTVVSSGMSSLSSVTMAPSSVGLPTTLGQCDVVLLPPLTLRGSGGVFWPCLCATAATSIFNVSSGLCQLCQGVSTGRFLFKIDYMFGVCSGICFLLSGAMLDAISTLGSSTFGFAPLQPLGVYLWQAYVPPGDGHQPTPVMHIVAAPFTTLSMGSLIAPPSAVPQHPVYMVGHTALGAWQRVTQFFCLPYMVGRELHFQVWFHPMTWFTLNL